MASFAYSADGEKFSGLYLIIKDKSANMTAVSEFVSHYITDLANQGLNATLLLKNDTTIKVQVKVPLGDTTFTSFMFFQNSPSGFIIAKYFDQDIISKNDLAAEAGNLGTVLTGLVNKSALTLTSDDIASIIKNYEVVKGGQIVLKSEDNLPYILITAIVVILLFALLFRKLKQEIEWKKLYKEWRRKK